MKFESIPEESLLSHSIINNHYIELSPKESIPKETIPLDEPSQDEPLPDDSSQDELSLDEHPLGVGFEANIYNHTRVPFLDTLIDKLKRMFSWLYTKKKEDYIFVEDNNQDISFEKEMIDHPFYI
jgi:hypothetical protein